jgi:hypothetical protein
VIVVRFVFDLSDEIENALLPPPADVLFKSRCDRFFLGAMFTDSAGLLDQAVIECKIRRQEHLLYTL